MNYRNKTTGAVSTQGEIRRANSNTSFPRVWDADVCTHLNVDPVLAAPQPSCTALEQVNSVAPVQDSLNNWVEGWAVVDKFSATTDDSVDPHNSGFIVNQVSATNINVSSEEYLFYAIA